VGDIVAMKRGNARGAKDPCRIDAFVRGEEYRLGQPDYGITLRAEMEAGTLAKWATTAARMPIYLGAAGCPCMLVSEAIR